MSFYCTSTGPIGGLNCEGLRTSTGPIGGLNCEVLRTSTGLIGGLNCEVLLYFNWSHRWSKL